MAIKFEWRYKTYPNGHKWIVWKATWDGKHDNDPLEDAVYPCHPFSGTCHYVQEYHLYKKLKKMTPEEKAREMIITAGKDDGRWREESLGNFAETAPEDHNPENIRVVGDIVAINPVTVALCEMLSRPEEIEKHSGNVHPSSYRNKLLCALDVLWD